MHWIRSDYKITISNTISPFQEYLPPMGLFEQMKHSVRASSAVYSAWVPVTDQTPALGRELPVPSLFGFYSSLRWQLRKLAESMSRRSVDNGQWLTNESRKLSGDTRWERS